MKASDIDILDQFVSLSLLDSPPMVVASDVWCDDVEQTDGELECLPTAVVSYGTHQKYIVPRNGQFLVPVPANRSWNTTKLNDQQVSQQNWTIYQVNNEQLQNIIDNLKNNGSQSLNNFYDQVQKVGKQKRQYF